MLTNQNDGAFTITEMEVWEIKESLLKSILTNVGDRFSSIFKWKVSENYKSKWIQSGTNTWSCKETSSSGWKLLRNTL